MSEQTEHYPGETGQRLIVETRLKLNAWLRVLPKRAGQELHELESLFLSVAAGDRLCLDACPSTCAEFELTSNRPDLIPHNSVCLAWAVFRKANELLQEHRTLRVSAYLEKRVPERTGLGGGSGDAGAALLALNQLHGCPLGHHQLVDLAVSLGSDVPFFVESGSCVVRGTGQIVDPIPRLPVLWCCIALPAFSVDTKEAYAALDTAIARRGMSEIDPEINLGAVMVSLRTRVRLDAPNGMRLNSFEATLSDNTADYLSVRNLLLADGAILSGLSGSGSAIFGIYAERAAAEAAAHDVQRRVGARTIVAEIL